MEETELQVELVGEPQGEIDRVAHEKPLVAVVVTKSGPLQLMPIVRLISVLRGADLSETAHHIKADAGIILRDATPEEAEALSEELHCQDVLFVLIPTRELFELARVARLARIRVGPDGMRLMLKDGGKVDTTWKDVLTITCVRLEGESDGTHVAPARLLLCVFTRQPFICYYLSQNIAGPRRPSGAPYEPSLRFERIGRAIFETYPRSSQNKGMRILSNYGLAGKWPGLTFDRLEEAQAYNYWVALLRAYQSDLRGKTRAKFSIPWLRKLEYEQEATRPSGHTRYRVVPRPEPTPVPSKPPVVVRPPDWTPEPTWRPSRMDAWLGLATLVAAVCLAIFIIVKFIG
jgi:hypothetical protein